MNEEFYSIGRGSLNIKGKFYCGLDYEITDFMRSLEEENQQLKEQNERLLELCMYALISSTKIYNHELANDTKKSFINIIKNNLNYDTYILKNKLLEVWRSDK